MSDQATTTNEKEQDALAIARAIRDGRTTARAVTEAALARIAAGDGAINSFTSVLSERALAQAEAIDQRAAAGHKLGPLAGVPFAAKNLFDVTGQVTLAGSIINASNEPAEQDAAAVHALTKADAVLVGTLNMDEYAYGFTTENTHYGACHNPHDLARVAGGSSGGSAAAVAAGFVPITLASDTNGSVRVPAALCGVFGLKPTYGRLSRRGMFPFCASLDHVGLLAGGVRDLAAGFDVLHGHDPADPVSADRPNEPRDPTSKDVRIALAGGYFEEGGTPEALECVARLAAGLGVTRSVTFPEAARARSAAYVITASESAQLHLADLRRRPEDFDPMTRDRFLAGALVPASAYLAAQRFRRWFRDQMREVFETVDVVLAPTTPCPAPLIGQRQASVGGVTVATQPYLGIYTQPLSFIGLPVLSVPAGTADGLPLGVQLIGRPFEEATLLQIAADLAARGLVGVTKAANQWR